MSTFVAVNTFTHTATYITDKMLHSLKYIIRESGLDPAQFVSDWEWMERGIKKWLETRDLERVLLEVYEPSNRSLINRWDFEIVYGYGSDGNGGMWVDTDAIKYAIKKAGYWPSQCKYRLVVETKIGRPDVAGWGPATLMSTAGLVRHSIGTTIGAVGAGTTSAYWRRS